MGKIYKSFPNIFHAVSGKLLDSNSNLQIAISKSMSAFVVFEVISCSAIKHADLQEGIEDFPKSFPKSFPKMFPMMIDKLCPSCVQVVTKSINLKHKDNE